MSAIAPLAGEPRDPRARAVLACICAARKTEFVNDLWRANRQRAGDEDLGQTEDTRSFEPSPLLQSISPDPASPTHDRRDHGRDATALEIG